MSTTGRLVAIDTATRQATLHLGQGSGRPLAGRAWRVGHRHAETLLPGLDELLRASGTARADLAGVVVGTGPGSFTGLRVGLATAKTLAHQLGLPLAGVPTAAALALAAWRLLDAPQARLDVLLPAGPSDRYQVPVVVADADTAIAEAPRLLTPEAPFRPSGRPLAVDLEADRGLSPEAVELGRLALSGLGESLLVLGATRIAQGDWDDPATLVPVYVTLPRGALKGGETWSPDLP